MDSQVQTYFLDRDYNCAESVLRILNDRYQLNLSDEDYTLLSGFGAGCGCGIICGALAGSVAALGKIKVSERAHVTPNFRKDCSDLCEGFKNALGSTDCAVVRPKYAKPGIRCAEVVEAAVQNFEHFMSEKNAL